MKVTWLGQAGLLFEVNGMVIMIDPYLSDNVRNYEPKNYRRVPVNESFLKIKPDAIVITHNHLDHLDKETLKHYLTPDSECLVLAPNGSWQEIREIFPSKSNYVLFDSGTSWTENGVLFRAVKAVHSDPFAIGVILTVETKKYYITGDTLYSEQIFSSLPNEKIHALFLPINGVGNNMNVTDASRFAVRVGASVTVPIHFGLFDSIRAETFNVPGTVVPRIWTEIPI